jgi:hypothetical protein
VFILAGVALLVVVQHPQGQKTVQQFVRLQEIISAALAVTRPTRQLEQGLEKWFGSVRRRTRFNKV